MLEAMDKKELTALVLLDLSKAFDSINHHRLLHKLANVGASPVTVQWFKSYLSDCFQSTRITPPYLIHYQSLTEYLKVRRFHHYYFVFTWTIFPPYLVTPALNRTLMTRKFSSPSHYVRLMQQLQISSKTYTELQVGAVKTTF
jgi:hypothetical protein